MRFRNLLLLAALGVAVTGAQQGPITISIVGTNDLHGGALPRGEGRGGLAIFSGYLKNLRQAREKDGGGVLLVDAGDMFQGTLESNLNEGAVIVRAYNALGYQAAAIGNHEFDFGPVGPAAIPQRPGDDPQGALKARAAEAHFPFLSANIVEAATGRPPAWPNVKPSMTIEIAGVKIGVIGASTEETPRTTIAADFAGLQMRPLLSTIAEAASELRKAGAALVVATLHEGGRCTALDQPENVSSCVQNEAIMTLANRLPRGAVDVMVAGHSHAGMAHHINGIAVIESFTGGVAFGRVDAEVTHGRVTRTKIFPPRDICVKEDPKTGRCDRSGNAELSPVRYEGGPIQSDARIDEILAPAVDAARVMKARTLGVTLETPITRRYSEESALGNLMTDLMRAAVPGADVAFTNGGGIRSDLPAGALTYGQLFEASPFDNQLLAIGLTGRQFRAVVTANLRSSGSFLSLSGAAVKAACQAGRLDVTLARPDGRSITDDEKLTIVTSDFIATGGDGFLSAAGPFETLPRPQGLLMRDAMAAELTKRGGRLRAEDLFTAEKRRVIYPGARPVACR